MRIIPTCAREELSAAQFILGEAYCDWMWQERSRASIAPPQASKAWPYKSAKDAENVVQMPKRKR